MALTQFESLRMLESPCSTIPPLPEVLPSRSDLLPNGHGVPGPVSEVVPEVALNLPKHPAQGLGSLHTAIPPPHDSPTPELVNGHVSEVLPVHTPPPESGVLVSHPAPHSRSPSPVRDAQPQLSPVSQRQVYEYEEEDDHFLRIWQQW